MPATPLTFYLSNFPSTIATTANLLFVKGGSTVTNQSYTTIGNNVLGWGEICAQGAGSGWAAAGSIGSPTGKGFFLDSPYLSGSTLLSGNWSASVRLNAAQGAGNPQAGTLTGDIVMRVFRYTAGTYTPIATFSLTGQTLTSNFTTYSLPSVAVGAITLTNEDRVYVDCWFNCTGNANNNGAQGIRLNRLTTDTTGLGDAASSITTPGYFSLSQDLAARFPLALMQDTAQSLGRGTPNAISPASDGNTYTLNGPVTWTMFGGPTRIQASTATGASYAILGTSSFGDSDVLVRFNVSVSTASVGVVFRYTDDTNHYRVRYAGGNLVLVVASGGSSTNLSTFSFSVNSSNNYYIRARAIGSALMGKIWQDNVVEPSSFQVIARDTTFTSGNSGLFVNLAATNQTVLLDRFVVTDAYPNRFDISTRVRLAAQSQRDLVGRVRIAVSRLRDVVARFALLAGRSRDLSLRLVLSSSLARLRDVATRVLLTAGRSRDLSLRLVLAGIRQMDVPSRLLLRATSLRDIRARLALFVQVQWNTATRVRIAASRLRDLATRFSLAGLSLRDLSSRLRLLAVRTTDLSGRMRLQVERRLDAPLRVRLLSVQRGDLAARLQLLASRTRDLPLRLSLTGLRLSDIGGRLRLLASKGKDLSLRVVLFVQRLRDIPARMRLKASVSLDILARLRLQVSLVRDLSGRVRLSGRRIADLPSRLALLSVQVSSLSGRMRLAAGSLRSLPIRFSLLVLRGRDLSTRLALASRALQDWQFRVRLSVLVLRTIPVRLTLFVTQAADMSVRLVLSRAASAQICILPLRLRLQGQAIQGNVPMRFVLSPFYHQDMILIPGNQTAPLL